MYVYIADVETVFAPFGTLIEVFLMREKVYMHMYMYVYMYICIYMYIYIYACRVNPMYAYLHTSSFERKDEMMFPDL